MCFRLLLPAAAEREQALSSQALSHRHDAAQPRTTRGHLHVYSHALLMPLLLAAAPAVLHRGCVE